MSTMFENTNNIAIVCIVVACLLFTVLFALRRLRHHSIWQKLLVILANIGAGIAIVGLVVGFYYTNTQAISVVLITPNTSEQAIQREERNNESTLKWFALADALSKESGLDISDKKDVIIISSVNQLSLHYPEISQITVLGDGLTNAQWDLLKGQYPVNQEILQQNEQSAQNTEQTFLYIEHKGHTPQVGLINMQWQNQLVVGQKASIRGQLQSPKNDNAQLYKLTLLDPMNEEIESQLLGADDTFSFAITASIPGQWLYKLQLTTRNSSAFSISENIAVQIVNAEPIKLMIKQSSPSFETRQLQSMVAEQGGKVLTLTKISKDKDIRQQININETQSTVIEKPFSPSALSFFDILIIDQQALKSLNAEQSQSLKLAIKTGLGVLVRAQTQHIDKWSSNGMNWLKDINIIEQLGSSNIQNLHYLRWPYQSLDTPISSVKGLIENTYGSALITDQNESTLVLSQAFGLGQVAVSLINTTYIWRTQGRADLHSQYWQWLFSQIARNNMLPHWQVSSQRPLTLTGFAQQKCITNAQEVSDIVLSQGEVNLPLAMNELLIDANTTCVNYSLGTYGWYLLNARLNSRDAATIALYASRAKAWKAMQQYERFQATSHVLRQQKQTSPRLITRTIMLNPYWFWLLLVVSLSILWIERKYFS